MIIKLTRLNKTLLITLIAGIANAAPSYMCNFCIPSTAQIRSGVGAPFLFDQHTAPGQRTGVAQLDIETLVPGGFAHTAAGGRQTRIRVSEQPVVKGHIFLGTLYRWYGAGSAGLGIETVAALESVCCKLGANDNE